MAASTCKKNIFGDIFFLRKKKYYLDEFFLRIICNQIWWKEHLNHRPLWHVAEREKVIFLFLSLLARKFHIHTGRRGWIRWRSGEEERKRFFPYMYDTEQSKQFWNINDLRRFWFFMSAEEIMSQLIQLQCVTNINNFLQDFSVFVPMRAYDWLPLVGTISVRTLASLSPQLSTVNMSG